MAGQLEGKDYQALVELASALQSSLQLGEALDAAVPILCQMTHSDHVALAISRPGTLYDYAWHNTSLPEAFLGSYPTYAEHDFVRKAVASNPNVVVRDQEMISRRALERHVVYQSALAAGTRLERVMAVMLTHEQDWSSGLSLYRSHVKTFDERDAEMLRLAIPMIRSTVQNSRRFDEARRAALMASTVQSAEMPVLWTTQDGVEVSRTAAATVVLERFFSSRERAAGVPEELLTPLRSAAQGPIPGAVAPEFMRMRQVNCLRVRYAPVASADSGQRLWALLLDVRGIPFEYEALLSRRQREVLSLVMRGHQASEIAQLQGRALSTIKQQTKQAYQILGVHGRNGLLSWIAGFGDR